MSLAKSIYRDVDLSHMRGVWAMRKGTLAVVKRTDNVASPIPLRGDRVAHDGHCWGQKGQFFGLESPHDFDLVEQLGSLDDVRRGAERLRQARCYVPAAMLFAFLGDDDAMQDAMRLRREEIERERREEEDKPF